MDILLNSAVTFFTSPIFAQNAAVESNFLIACNIKAAAFPPHPLNKCALCFRNMNSFLLASIIL